MDASLIAPELRARASRLPRLPLGSRAGRWLVRVALRLAPRDRSYTAPDKITLGDAPGLRLYSPTTQLAPGALLWIHGGGFVIGHAGANDAFCAGIARDLGVTVVSLDYRLAPEHPYPAALDDGVAAWTWIRDQAASLGIDPRRIIVGGQSAGGGLAASLVQRLRDLGNTAVHGQWLLSPMLDDRTAADVSLDAIDHPLWNNRLNRIGWQAYLACEAGASPPAGSVPARDTWLKGSPCTWIGCGAVDLFFEENKVYAERLRQAGVSVVEDWVQGAPHGFEVWAADSECAVAYLRRAKTWLGDRFRAAPA